MITQNQLQTIAENLWIEYCEIFPKLVKFDCPKIAINNRFKTTAGQNWVEQNIVQLSGKHLAKFEHIMVTEILPHEMAHQIDYNLNGWPKNNRWHSDTWKIVMIKIGQEPARCHTMVL